LGPPSGRFDPGGLVTWTGLPVGLPALPGCRGSRSLRSGPRGGHRA